MEGLLADLADAAGDDVVDRRRVDAGALDQRVEHRGAEVDRMHVLERAVAAAAGGAHRVDDIGFSHWL